jgi:radical SAM superfamily enzyme YgiQ (UPF0313 family)
VPLEIGYIKAYALAKLNNEVEINLFRTFESLYKAIEVKEPDILGCSWYGWSRWLTTNALTYLKSKRPNIITVVGGPNVPETAQGCMDDFREFPCIDIMIPNEGEIPFFNVLKAFTEGGRKDIFDTPIDGVFYLSDSRQEVIAGKPLKSVEDVNIFPSPYLDGHLDQFLNSELMPILQTTRGCPFKCSFCVSARDSWSRLRPFDAQRVKDEIDYLEANAKNRTIRFADENFGILARDLGIARFIAQKRELSAYPSALRVYTHKEVNDNIKEITLLLRDLIPLNISSQTLTGSVLLNIRRKNINLNKFHEAIKWAHEHNINATTEIIFGLPGETVSSFMKVIDELVKLRLDSVAIGTLMMLKETEINRPQNLSRFGYKILYSIAERGFTKVGDFENVEIDAWAVESNDFSLEEYIRINLFNLIYKLFMFWGYFKEMVYIWENRGVKISDCILELLDNPQAYPFIAGQIDKLNNCLRDNLFKDPDDVRRIFSKRFSGNDGSGQYVGFLNHFILSKIIKGDMIHISNQQKLIDEVIKAATVVFRKIGKNDLSEFSKEMQFAKVLIENIIIPFWQEPQETVEIASPYDLEAWRNQDYRGTLLEFKLAAPVTYQYRVHSLSQYINFIRENSNKPFYEQSEFFFRNFRSNNVRRFLVSDIENENIANKSAYQRMGKA